MLKDAGIEAKRPNSGSFDATYKPSSPKNTTNDRTGSQQPARPPRAPHANERRSASPPEMYAAVNTPRANQRSAEASHLDKSFQPAPRIKRRPEEPWSGTSSQPVPRRHREPRSDDGDRDGASKPSRRIKRAKIREPRSDDGQGGRTPAFGGIARRTTEHKPHILCTNNALDRRLIANGGARPLGSNHQCFQRGVGAGLHHQPEDLETFLRNFSSPYKKLVEQPLYYGDKEVPAGKIRATRPQAMQKGFGVGQMLKAKRILAERKKKLLARPLE